MTWNYRNGSSDIGGCIEIESDNKTFYLFFNDEYF